MTALPTLLFQPRLLVAALGLVALPAIGQSALPYAWAASGGSHQHDDTGRAVAVDATGNVYVAGRFRGIAAFGTDTLRSALTNPTYPSQDIFLVKYNASGAVIWARQAGGPDDDSAIGIDLDAAGNAYVSGYFSGYCSIAGDTLVAQGSYDALLFKYDGNGTFKWARNAGGFGNDEGWGVAVDPLGNATLTGYFDNALRVSDSITVVADSGSFRRPFVARYDASGQPLWARIVGGTSGLYARGIAADAVGNVYVTGNTTGDQDAFVASYDAQGQEVWVRQYGSGSVDRGITIAADAYGEVFVSGQYVGTVAFGADTLTSAGPDMFLLKLNAANGTAVWARSGGGSSTDYGIALALDVYGNPVVTGFFTSSATFGTVSLTGSPGTSNPDIFRVWYDFQGNCLGAEAAGSSDAAIGYGVAVDAAGDTYVTGAFSGSVTFAPHTLQSTGELDSFVAKVSSSVTLLHPPRVTGTANERAAMSLVAYPNPVSTTGSLSVELPADRAAAPLTIELLDVLGRGQSLPLTSLDARHAALSLTGCAPGSYTLRVRTAGYQATTRVLVLP